jgi:hypothetical protein
VATALGTSVVRSASVSFSVESDGRSDPLRHQVSSGVLRSRVCGAVAMVGVWVLVQRCEPDHLGGSGRCMVEVLGPVVVPGWCLYQEFSRFSLDNFEIFPGLGRDLDVASSKVKDAQKRLVKV